jgi:hypothetical protein
MTDKFIYWYLHGDGVYWAILLIVGAVLFW